MNKRVYIGGTPVDAFDRPELLRIVADWLEKPIKPRQVVTLNANMLIKALNDPKLNRAILKADLVTPDGYGIFKALQKKGCSVEAVTGVDLLRDLLINGAKRETSVYFWGGSLQVVRRLGAVLPAAYPGLRIAAIRDGYESGCTKQSVVRELRTNPPDLLIVGLGTPTQEILLSELLPTMNKTVGIGIGGALDVLAGVRSEAPGFMRRNGLEWLYRMIQDPRRLNRLPDLFRFWMRYLH